MDFSRDLDIDFLENCHVTAPMIVDWHTRSMMIYWAMAQKMGRTKEFAEWHREYVALMQYYYFVRHQSLTEQFPKKGELEKAKKDWITMLEKVVTVVLP